MVFDTKKHTNVKRKAAYRQIGKYYKGVERFKEKKARCTRILELQDKGLTIKQIALEIRVSERTVKRDLAKMKSHIHRQKARLIRDSHEQTIVHFNSSSLKKQIKYIQGIRRVKARLIKTRRCKSLVITIDVNKAFGGRYKAVKVKPDLPVEMLDNGRITLD